MATLTVWTFDSTTGAEDGAKALLDLSLANPFVVHDAAVAEWEDGKNRPSTRQLDHLEGSRELGGAFWGLLFGLVFLVPLLGAAVGVTTGALAGALTDVGIDDGFINEIRRRVTPGTSALFVMTADGGLEVLREAFGDAGPTLVSTDLSDEQERALVDVFGE